MSKVSEVKVTQNGGVGFVGLLTILFIALKLMGYITWSWWWVLSPIWISFLVVIAIFIVALLVAVVLDK